MNTRGLAVLFVLSLALVACASPAPAEGSPNEPDIVNRHSSPKRGG